MMTETIRINPQFAKARNDLRAARILVETARTDSSNAMMGDSNFRYCEYLYSQYQAAVTALAKLEAKIGSEFPSLL